MVLLPTIPPEVYGVEDEDETFLLPTLQVKVHGPTASGNIRGLMTWASDYCLLSEKAWRQFGLPLQNAAVSSIRNLIGVVIEVVGLSRIKISPHFNDEATITMEVVVVKNIYQRVTSSKVHPIVRMNLSDKQLADPFFDEPGEIDILFGAPATPTILNSGLFPVYGPCCSALNTTLGWVVMGRAPIDEDPGPRFLLD